MPDKLSWTAPVRHLADGMTGGKRLQPVMCCLQPMLAWFRRKDYDRSRGPVCGWMGDGMRIRVADRGEGR